MRPRLALWWRIVIAQAIENHQHRSQAEGDGQRSGQYAGFDAFQADQALSACEGPYLARKAQKLPNPPLIEGLMPSSLTI